MKTLNPNRSKRTNFRQKQHRSTHEIVAWRSDLETRTQIRKLHFPNAGDSWGMNQRFRGFKEADFPRRWEQDLNRASHVRSNQNPENAVAQSHTSVRLMAALCGSRVQFAVFTFGLLRRIKNLPAALSVTFKIKNPLM